MLSPKFLEVLNGSLLLLLAFVVFVFARYIIRRVVQFGWRRGYFHPGTQAAVAILVTASGDAILRGWFWYWRVLTNAGTPVEWMEHVPIPVIGWAIQFFGAICLIRVFSPSDWKRWTWIACAVVAVGAATMFAFF